MGILHAFSNCVRETFNHGLSPSEVDLGDPKGDPTKMLKYTSNGNMLIEVDWGDYLKLNYTSSRSMLMEADWGGKLKPNYTSCGSMLMDVNWGGKLIINYMVDWGAHETHPNGHNISKVDCGGHGSSANHMAEFLISEVDWGAHDSSIFLFLVNIEYDAKVNGILHPRIVGRTTTDYVLHSSHLAHD